MKTTKPTGNPKANPYVERAHEAEKMLNDEAGSRDLDDDEIADIYWSESDRGDDAVVVISSDNEDENIPPPPRKLKGKVKAEPGSANGPVARRPANDRLPSRARNSGKDILANISNALDPDIQASRLDDRTARSVQTNQMFMLTAQLESMRNRLAEAERERHTAERRADRAEMMAHIASTHQSNNTAAPPLPGHRSRRRRQDVFHAGGGRSTYWVGSDDDDPFFERRPDTPGTRRITYQDDDDPFYLEISAPTPSSTGIQAARQDASQPPSSINHPHLSSAVPTEEQATNGPTRSPRHHRTTSSSGELYFEGHAGDGHQ